MVAGSVLSTSPGAADFSLVRYNSNGSLDTTFGIRGRVTARFSGRGDGALALAIQSDGRIVAAGSTRNFYDDDFALARYNRNGSLDATFGTAGKITTDFSGSGDAIYAIAIQADGKVVAAGEMRANPGPDSSPTGVIVRYKQRWFSRHGFRNRRQSHDRSTEPFLNFYACGSNPADGKIIAARVPRAVAGRRTIGVCLSGTTLTVRWTRLLETGEKLQPTFSVSLTLLPWLSNRMEKLSQ